MKVTQAGQTLTYVTRDDGIKCIIARDLSRNLYLVYKEGRDTGYKFRSKKKALEYIEFGF